MWPEEGNTKDVARRGEFIVIWLRIRVHITDVAKRGEYNGCGQKRVIQRMWPEEGNINDLARSG